VCSLAVNDRRQAEDCNLSPNTMQSNRMFVTVCQHRTIPCRRTAVIVVFRY